MKACLYLRYSDPSQKGNTTIKTQLDRCKEACERDSLDIWDIVKDEAVSADSNKSIKTHRVTDLLNFCRKNKGKFEILMVYNTDRFARSLQEHTYLRAQLRSMGILLKSATENLGESFSDKFVEGVMAAKNEYDNDMRKERAVNGLWGRVEEKLFPWTPPFGYKIVKSYDGKLRPHIPDDPCATVVIEIFKKYATGTVSKSELSREYSKKNIVNYKGKKTKFSPQLIDKILHKKYYAGILDHKTKGEIVGLHKPIISLELFKKCQKEVQVRSNNRAKYRQHINDLFPIRKFARCSLCNEPLTAAVEKNNPYYWCKKIKPEKCPNCYKSIKAGIIHNEFYEYLKTVKPRQEFVDRFAKRVLEKYGNLADLKSQLYKEKTAVITKLQADKDWIMERGKKGIFDDETLKEELEKNKRDLNMAKAELAEIWTDEVNIEDMLSKAKQFIETLENTWYDAPIEVKDRLQKFIFPGGVIYTKNDLKGTFETSKLNPLFRIITEIGSQKVSKNKQLCPTVILLETMREAIQGLKDLISFTDTLPLHPQYVT